MNLRFSLLFCLLLLVAGLKPLGAEILPAELRMPAIFGDHMVLQQDVKVPVWGWATPNDKVKVTLGSQEATATADATGNWRVNLNPLPEDKKATPMVMTITAGTKTIAIQDVLVGDVWLCSGQSNMEFGVGNLENAADVISKANEPMVRLFFVTKYTSLEPLKDVKDAGKDSLMGHWQICTPETLGKDGGWGGFTAVGYFFGREIQKTVGHPVGLIGAYWGGTPAQSWTSVEGLAKEPTLANYVAAQKKNVENYPKAQGEWPAVQEKFKTDKELWEKEINEPMKAKMAEWEKAVADAGAKGVPPPPKPVPARPQPAWPITPDGGPNAPANLYHGMIAPIIPYALKGAIWYQGESNAGSEKSGIEYVTLFARMITDWRERWGLGDFPFLFVQLAAFTDPAKTPAEGGWPWLREAQLKTLKLPNTGMAVAVDVGNPYDVHPKDKLDVGLRLALAAKHVAYGQDIPYSGPIYDSMKVEGNKIILSFKHAEGGLKIAPPPWAYYGTPKTPTELTGFGIAGADKNFVWAKAEIQGDKVVVSADSVAAPVAVRYGWGNCPAVDLYNTAGLPASPFRTDDWE